MIFGFFFKYCISTVHLFSNTRIYFFSKRENADIKEIKNEIRSVIRQITASITFLPLLETACKYFSYSACFITQLFY